LRPPESELPRTNIWAGDAGQFSTASLKSEQMPRLRLRKPLETSERRLVIKRINKWESH